MLVTRDELERGLAELCREVADPRAGLGGPGSETWRLNRELVNFVGGGRAALLQLAHPFVGQAIPHHSVARNSPRVRFQRTFARIFEMTFGDLDQALAAARRVHAVHTRVVGTLEEDVGRFPRGTRYAANDSSALLWVHATLIDTVLLVRELFVGAMSPAERERYYRETRRFAALFGIPAAELPPDHEAFAAYMREMLDSDTLAVGRGARETADALLEPPTPALAPAVALYRTITAGLMPPRLRDGFGLRFGRVDAAAFRATAAAMRRLYRLAPAQARVLPAYIDAADRVGLREGGAISRAVARGLSKLDFWPDAAR